MTQPFDAHERGRAKRRSDLQSIERLRQEAESFATEVKALDEVGRVVGYLTSELGKLEHLRYAARHGGHVEERVLATYDALAGQRKRTVAMAIERLRARVLEALLDVRCLIAGRVEGAPGERGWVPPWACMLEEPA